LSYLALKLHFSQPLISLSPILTASQKVIKAVTPAKAGVQNCQFFLDSGSRFSPGQVSFSRNDRRGHFLTSYEFINFVASVAEMATKGSYVIWIYFARTSLKNMSKIETAVARIVGFILRHSRNVRRKRTALPAR
jgi:hypothetical protein